MPSASITVGTTVVKGYYTFDGTEYTLITTDDQKAEDGVTYYVDVASFTLVEIADGRYGIDLSEYGENIHVFNNELVEDMYMIVDDVKIVTLPGVRIYAENSITPKGNAYTIDQMGLSNYFIPTSNWNSKLKIIGFVEEDDDAIAEFWVDHADDVNISDDTVYGTISISNNASGGKNTYNIKKITYSADGGSYYSISQDYYYITGNGSISDLVVPNYTGVETYLYSIAYNPNNSGVISLDLSTAVKVWEMVDGALTNRSAAATYGNDEADNGFAVLSPTTGITNPEFDKGNKKLTMSANVLSNYKLENPNVYSYPTIEAQIQVNDTTIKLVLEFVLPNEIPQFFISSANNTVALSKLVTELTAAEAYEKYFDKFEVGATSSVLTLKSSVINEYFTVENTEATRLVLNFKATVGTEIEDVQVVVYKATT